jgi:hypothetical protein
MEPSDLDIMHSNVPATDEKDVTAADDRTGPPEWHRSIQEERQEEMN